MNIISLHWLRLCAAVLFMVLFANANAQSLPLTVTNEVESKAEGLALIREILAQRPAESVSVSGLLTVRNGQRKVVEVPVRFETVTTLTNWTTSYATSDEQPGDRYAVEHVAGQPNNYGEVGRKIWKPFAGSDFWLVDLGLDFFHWPDQRLIRKEICRTRSCKVIESINPQPASNNYSRVRSWIDRETLAMVYAEAYDAQGRKLKEFLPKGIRKVDEQWQLEAMEMRNVQTGSRTRIEFDLKKSEAVRP